MSFFLFYLLFSQLVCLLSDISRRLTIGTFSFCKNNAVQNQMQLVKTNIYSRNIFILRKGKDYVTLEKSGA